MFDTWTGTATMLTWTEIALEPKWLRIVPLALVLPSQTPRTAFQFSVLFFFNNDLPLPFGSQIRTVVSFMNVFTKDVLQIMVDLSDGECDLFLLPRGQRFLNMANFTFILLSHSKMTIDPFFSNVAVSTHLNCCSFGASVEGGIRRAHYSWFFTFSFPFLASNSCPVHSRMI